MLVRNCPSCRSVDAGIKNEDDYKKDARVRAFAQIIGDFSVIAKRRPTVSQILGVVACWCGVVKVQEPQSNLLVFVRCFYNNNTTN